MKKQARLSSLHKNLVRRYLLWAYKTTRESFERIERKTTQLIVDEFILDYFVRRPWGPPKAFKAYIDAKRKDELKLKFCDGKRTKLNPEYLYLQNRLSAIEAAVRYFLGPKELQRFGRLYESEFTRRILEATQH